RFLRRQAPVAEMHAPSVRRESDVQAIVDQNARAVARRGGFPGGGSRGGNGILRARSFVVGKTFLVCRLVEARGCEAHGFASERAALFSGEILLAELDPVDAGLHSRSDFLEENFVSLWGFRRHKAA